MVLNIPKTVFEAALKLMRMQGLTAKQAVAKVKSTIPGAAAIDTRDLEKKLEAEASKPMAIAEAAYKIESVQGDQCPLASRAPPRLICGG